jgi:hypothetical protein
MANLMNWRIEQTRACRRTRPRLDEKPAAAKLSGLRMMMSGRNAPVRTDAKRRPRRGYDPAIGQTLNKVLM